MGNLSMRFVMSLADRFFGWGINEAEGRMACLIEPVGHKTDTILVLHLEIVLMRVGKSVLSRTFHVMTVHVDGHTLLHLLICDASGYAINLRRSNYCGPLLLFLGFPKLRSLKILTRTNGIRLPTLLTVTPVFPAGTLS